ncbi:hypothetical protein Patl1_14935 [Pistacia atlantica]|uniref:Uncharacterized protein n=1 Tax=Pistacia atlantica TaxID=434234 RepID=A0ACC1B7P2_9ROSI|nr:hypothetical protein Patl1_14935 [Pistacia atlantica]
MTSTTLALSSATSSLINRPLSNACFSSCVAVSSLSACNNNENGNRRKGRMICCEVAVKSNNSTPTVGFESNPSEEEAKIGAKVRVKVPLKVYHVPRVPEVDLTGMEGVLKQNVAVFKGKKISANMPYKVQFVTQVEGRGPVKFFAHLKEDEFDYLD